MRKWQIFLGLGGSVLIGTAQAGATPIFRCDSPDGGTVFADKPCASDAAEVKIDHRMLGGRLDGGASRSPVKDTDLPHSDGPAASPAASPCRSFQSTRLRTHLIREEVVPGMTREHVREAWGSPSEAYPEPIEMWVYDTDYYGRLVSVTRVYFEDGCVTDVDRTAP